MIIWTYICIYSMNIQNIFHNDLKIDNILMKERFNDIIYIQNIVIGNNTKYEYFLNDFDMTLNKNIFDDITTFRNSVYRMFTKRLKNNKEVILTAINNCYYDFYNNMEENDKIDYIKKRIKNFST